MSGVAWARDHGGHLLYRTRSVGPSSLDLVHIAFRRPVIVAPATPAVPSPFDVDAAADEEAVFHYVHGAVWPTVKAAVEYACDVADRFSPAPRPAGWFSWLWSDNKSGAGQQQDVGEQEGRVATVTVCSFDLLAKRDVRIVVDYLKGTVSEVTVDSEGKATEQHAADLAALMRGVAASQLIRIGRAGLSLCPVAPAGGVPLALVRVLELPRGAALEFCNRHREFAQSLSVDLLVDVLYVEMRWGAWSEVQEWIDDTFRQQDDVLKLVLLTLCVFEDRPSSSLSKGVHLGRVTLNKFPMDAQLVLAQCRLLLKSKTYDHCLTLLERVPNLTEDAAQLHECAILRATTYSGKGDLLGCLEILQRMCVDGGGTTVASGPAAIEFPLVKLVTHLAEDTVGSELANLVYPKFALLFGFDHRMAADEMLWALTFVRDKELVLETIRGGNAEGKLHPLVWKRLELVGHVFSSCESILDKRFCLAFALAWHRVKVLQDSVYCGLVASLRHCNPTKQNVVLFSACVYVCAELALSSATAEARDMLVKDTVGAAEELGSKAASNFLVQRAFCLFRESEILIKDDNE